MNNTTSDSKNTSIEVITGQLTWRDIFNNSEFFGELSKIQVSSCKNKKEETPDFRKLASIVRRFGDIEFLTTEIEVLSGS